MNTNPKKQIRGATLILLTLKMSGSKAVSVVPGPIMSKKPIITIIIPAANRMKHIHKDQQLSAKGN